MGLLNHNLWRRVNVVKVISVSEFNYLPQMLPMNVPIPLLSLFEKKRGEVCFFISISNLHPQGMCVCMVDCFSNKLFRVI